MHLNEKEDFARSRSEAAKPVLSVAVVAVKSVYESVSKIKL